MGRELLGRRGARKDYLGLFRALEPVLSPLAPSLYCACSALLYGSRSLSRMRPELRLPEVWTPEDEGVSAYHDIGAR